MTASTALASAEIAQASAAWSGPPSAAPEPRAWWGSSAMGSMPPAPSVLGRPIPRGAAASAGPGRLLAARVRRGGPHGRRI
uniref:Uncharacterized protein n=1 Tax=Setaria italica TaxID=4555 RepID=K4ANA0_SETIT